MIWHCVASHSVSGYCNGTPEWDRKPDEMKDPVTGETRYLSGGTCKLTPETCGKYQTLLETLDPAELERISHSTYVETIIPLSPEKKAQAKADPKSKAARKLEQEIAQGKMF